MTTNDRASDGARERMTNKARLNEIAAIIEAVDNRCMAADGPVTPTLQEMTQAEISRIYQLASDFPTPAYIAPQPQGDREALVEVADQLAEYAKDARHKINSLLDATRYRHMNEGVAASTAVTMVELVARRVARALSAPAEATDFPNPRDIRTSPVATEPEDEELRDLGAKGLQRRLSALATERPAQGEAFTGDGGFNESKATPADWLRFVIGIMDTAKDADPLILDGALVTDIRRGLRIVQRALAAPPQESAPEGGR